MGKMLPVDETQPFNSSDVVCLFCKSPFGGLIYVEDRDVFVHRDTEQCKGRRAKTRKVSVPV